MMTLRERAKKMTDRQIDDFFDDIEDTCVLKSTAFLLAAIAGVLGVGIGYMWGVSC
jgi:hypothetical protein